MNDGTPKVRSFEQSFNIIIQGSFFNQIGVTKSQRNRKISIYRQTGRGRLKTRDWKTRHQLAGVENEGINCMDSQWDNLCNLLE